MNFQATTSFKFPWEKVINIWDGKLSTIEGRAVPASLHIPSSGRRPMPSSRLKHTLWQCSGLWQPHKQLLLLGRLRAGGEEDGESSLKMASECIACRPVASLCSSANLHLEI